LKTVKCEEVYVRHYQTFEEAQAHLQTFLEGVYNAKRLHSSLEYVPPDEFEAEYLNRMSGILHTYPSRLRMLALVLSASYSLLFQAC
jgi:hypothetical protein